MKKCIGPCLPHCYSKYKTLSIALISILIIVSILFLNIKQQKKEN